MYITTLPTLHIVFGSDLNYFLFYIFEIINLQKLFQMYTYMHTEYSIFYCYICFTANSNFYILISIGKNFNLPIIFIFL